MANGEAADDRTTSGTPGAEEELARLRAEVTALRAQAGSERRKKVRLLTVRRVAAAVLIALAAVLTVTAVIGVWGARTTLNTGRWVDTVDDLPRHPAVNKAVSAYLTDQIFTELDVEQRLSEALPERASFLAAPVTGAVRNYVRDSVSKLIATDEFRTLWRATNRSAHGRIVAVLENRNKNVRAEGDTVTLNLLPMVNNALATLEDRLPTLFGKQFDLPRITSGQIPPGLHDRVEKALGVTLPDDFGQVRLYNRGELSQVQDAVLLFKRAVWGLVIAVPVLLGLALWVSPNRRRTVLQFGLWLVVSVTVLTSVLRAVRDQLLAQVTPGTYRDGVRDVLWTVFETLRDRGAQLLWLGVAIAVIAYLVGPGRLPVWLRRTVAEGARIAGAFVARTARRGTGTGARQWVGRHADVLRVGGLVVAVLVTLLLASWTALLVVALLLLGYEAAVTLVARGAADHGEATTGKAASGETASGENPSHEPGSGDDASPTAGEAAPGPDTETDAAPVTSRQGGNP
ncbi:hypothetical protein [Streptomyces kanamyceticus]|uniref:Integral membrane protein n=1 Tax=Streptomyces kanamyceticus TaxID=1967 RepID=A0A5J6GHH6_STRKN|nr:hypothetical protein [Streptomyces kanamyceticus]QEU93308.1 hypothetical protein CP970_22395 [Streptomyces kanamyceticus]